jgi:hypothetical protein
LIQEELNRKEEEIAHKVIALTVNGTKMTVTALKNMLEKYIEEQKQKNPKIYKGKQSVKHLTRSGAKLTNIEITDQNIKSFSRTVRKYGIDFALRKDNTAEIPRYFVFFKAKDADVLNAAFKEFLNKEMTKSDKPKIHKRIKGFMQKSASIDKERSRDKNKTREAEL